MVPPWQSDPPSRFSSTTDRRTVTLTVPVAGTLQSNALWENVQAPDGAGLTSSTAAERRIDTDRATPPVGCSMAISQEAKPLATGGSWATSRTAGSGQAEVSGGIVMAAGLSAVPC